MSCEICGKTNNLKSCGRCLKANYCGREHQLAHWKDHKRWCVKNGSMAASIANCSTNFLYNTVNNDHLSNIMNGVQQQQQQQQQSIMEDIFQTDSANQSMNNSHQSNNELMVNFMNHHQMTPSTSSSSSPDHIQTHTQNNNPMLILQNHQSSQPAQMLICDPQQTTISNYTHQMNVATLADSNCNSYENASNSTNLKEYSHSSNNMMHIQTNNNISMSAQQQVIQQPLSNPTMMINSATAAAGNHHQFNTTLTSPYMQNRDFVLNNLNKYCQIILKDMNNYGFCVIDDFLQNGDLILNEVSMLYERGLFQAGQVVNIKANSNSKLIRGDKIIWVEGNEQICSNIGFLVRILDSIICRCNQMAIGEFYKYRINRRTKAMIACYPGNYTKYVRHVDNPNNDGRCITSIYYLNKNYDRARDGGVLRLFPQMNDGIVADIEPRFNRVIFFWSDRRNPHEVMPSTRMRFAITVWYFDANERAKAIQKYKENSIQCPNDKDLVPF